MSITQTEALAVVSLEMMKTELRIPLAEASHDELLSGQIHSAANFCAQSTGRPLSDLHLLRAAIISSVRSQYDGLHEVSPNAAHNAWMEPFRTLAD